MQLRRFGYRAIIERSIADKEDDILVTDSSCIFLFFRNIFKCIKEVVIMRIYFLLQRAVNRNIYRGFRDSLAPPV